MNRVRVGIVGANGYSGAVATRLLAAHPGFELVFCTSDASKGLSVAGSLGIAKGADLTYAPNSEAEARALEVDAVCLATPASVSLRLAPGLVAKGKVVIDFSGAFRLASAADFLLWYKEEHTSPELLSVAHYGLPELFGPPVRPLGKGLLVANPGCYATASLLALAPLLKAGLIESRGIIIDGKSGVSGAGRQSKESYSFVELDEDARAYKLLGHQHTPEIARYLGRATSGPLPGVTFTPHLLPCKRGILATCYGRPRAGVTTTECVRALEREYRGRPFVTVVSPDEVTLRSVVGTQSARVGVVANDDVVVAVASIDNLLKGAAGQAIQTLNLIYGMNETAGLDYLHRTSP